MDRAWRVAVIAVTLVRRTLRRPLSLVGFLAVPLFFAVLASSLFRPSGEPPALAVVVEDRGPRTQELLRQLADTPMALRHLDRDQAAERLRQGRERVVLLVPQGFSASVDAGSPKLELWYGPQADTGMEVPRVRAVAAGLVAGQVAGPVPVAVQGPRPQADPDRYPLARTVFGFYAMFALTTLISLGGALHGERNQGTLARMLVTGTSYTQVVGGYAVALFLTGLFQATVLLGCSALLGAPWLAAGLPALLLVLLGTLVACSGIALAVAGHTRTQRQITAASTILGTVAAMIGGAFWPLDVVPRTLQEAARLSPVYWALDALREAFAFGGSVAAQLPALGVLVLMGLLAGSVGVVGLYRRTA